MSGLETLPPDQRAVLKLILEQGRGYAELAELLKVDPAAVRTRAHAGVEALAVPGAAELTPEQRAQVADYLLGQQDEGERIVALAELGDSPAAVHWGQALRDRLAPLARQPLPELPGFANGNGVAPAAAATPAPAAAAPAPPPPPEVPTAALPVAPPVSTPAAPAVAAPAAPPSSSAPAAAAPRPSRLGGAIVLAVVVAAIAVIAILLLTGGDDEPSRSASTPAATQTQTQPSTTPATGQGQFVGQVNFKPTPAGGSATGVGLVQQNGRKLALAVQAEKLPANGQQDIYAVWLQNDAGAKLLGYVPTQVQANGTFTVTAPVPRTARNNDTILIAREQIQTGPAPSQPGEAILSGPLLLRG